MWVRVHGNKMAMNKRWNSREEHTRIANGDRKKEIERNRQKTDEKMISMIVVNEGWSGHSRWKKGVIAVDLRRYREGKKRHHSLLWTTRMSWWMTTRWDTGWRKWLKGEVRERERVQKRKFELRQTRTLRRTLFLSRKMVRWNDERGRVICLCLSWDQKLHCTIFYPVYLERELIAVRELFD